MYQTEQAQDSGDSAVIDYEDVASWWPFGTFFGGADVNDELREVAADGAVDIFGKGLG